MASGVVFDPLLTLRLRPLAAATTTFLIAFGEHFTLTTLRDVDAAASSSTASAFIDSRSSPRSIALACCMLGLTAAECISNLDPKNWPQHAPGLGGVGSDAWVVAFWGYAAGAGLSLAGIVVRVLMLHPSEREVGGKMGVVEVEQWMWWDRTRLVLCDAGAVLAVLTGVIASMRF